MRIHIAAPAPARARTGNRVTADRWAAILRDLGHDVVLSEVPWDGRDRRETVAGAPAEAGGVGAPSAGLAGGEAPSEADVLLALHARRSHRPVRRFRELRPDGSIILALTGTDLYRDLPDQQEARASCFLADRLVVLQEKALEAVPPPVREKARVIYQSVPELWARRPAGGRSSPDSEPPRRAGPFRVCLIAHLRDVKDPLRAAEAARRLPEESRVLVVHCGRALTEELGRRAAAEAEANPRYHWLGEVPREDALRILEDSDLLVLTSRMEGAGNAVSEALSADVPVICTRVDGLVGMLGEDYPGYVPVGDTEALANLLRRAESDGRFYAALRDACRRRAPLVDPERERRAWATLLGEL